MNSSLPESLAGSHGLSTFKCQPARVGSAAPPTARTQHQREDVRDAESPEFVKQLGSTAEYVVGHRTWEPKLVLGHPGIKQFVESYENRYGEMPNYHVSQDYAG